MPKNNSKKEKTPDIIPLGDRVLLREYEKENESKTASGLIIPNSADSDHQTKKAVVVAVGKGKYLDGKYLEPEIKKGDKVLYNWGDEISIAGEKFVLASLDNVTAIIKK